MLSKNFIFSISPQSLEKAWYDPTLSGQGKSPVKVCFINQQNRRTGYFNGSILEQIPNSTYDEEFNVVKIRSPPETKITVRNPDDPYKKITIIEPSYFMVEVIGIDTGHYRLELVNVALEYKSVVIVEGDTWAGKVDRYWLVVYKDGLIYQRYGPPPKLITYGFGHQMVVAANNTDPDSYDRRQSTTFIPK